MIHVLIKSNFIEYIEDTELLQNYFSSEEDSVQIDIPLEEISIHIEFLSYVSDLNEDMFLMLLNEYKELNGEYYEIWID